VFNEDIGVKSVAVLVDDVMQGDAEYGLHRPDVVTVMQVTSDPQRPALGFSFQLDTTALANGPATLSVRFENHVGEIQYYGDRRVIIQNP
jgi:hypothetical protein